MPQTKPTSEQVTFLQAGTGATQRTALAKLRDTVSVKDFGVVGDGVTDDTVAFTSAIAYQQSSGIILKGTNGTILLNNWTTITLLNPFYFDGMHGTIKCGNTQSTAFVNCQNDFDVAYCVFDGWFRVLDCTETAARISVGVFRHNTCNNSRIKTGSGASNFAFALSFKTYFDFIWVYDCNITKASVIGIQAGVVDGSGNKQPTLYVKMVVEKTTVSNVDAGAGLSASSVFGIQFIGGIIEYASCTVSDVEGTAAALGSAYENGAMGLYCKATNALVTNNYVYNIGINTKVIAIGETAGILTKGSNAIVENNRVNDIGKVSEVTYGSYGIASDDPDIFIVKNNQIYNSHCAISASGKTVVIESNDVGNGNRNNATLSQIYIGGKELYPKHIVKNNTVVITNFGAPCIKITSGSIGAQNGYVIVESNSCLSTTGSTALLGRSGIEIEYGVNNQPFLDVDLISNKINGTYYGILCTIIGTYGTNDIFINNNNISNTVSPLIMSALAGITVKNNTGYITNSENVVSAYTTGTDILHGLSAIPKTVFVTALTAGVTDCTVTNIDATRFRINFGGTTPASFCWSAKTVRYFGLI